MEYQEEDFLLLSGIQHFCFCRRQWALIHVEQQWQENIRTVEGNIVHEHCHDDTFFEKRGNTIITRGLRIFSNKLGVTGQCDVVEFYKSEDGCVLQNYDGRWSAYPIEYKRGKSKTIDADRLQLCAQAICLEQMLSTNISKGALYYNETHRREEVLLTTELRNEVYSMVKEMHDYFKRGFTPKVKPKSGCNSCSLKELCLPKLCTNSTIDKYYAKFLGEE